MSRIGSGVDLDECLAIARLRQWAMDRHSIRAGRNVSYEREGWVRRRTTSYDAVQVRVIDMERALNLLNPEERLCLVMRYRDGQRDEATARIVGRSQRWVGYTIPKARLKLAQILDRWDML